MLFLRWANAPDLLSMHIMQTTSIFLTLLLHIVGSALGVRIRELVVPSVALQDDEVRLRCDYEDEGGSSLYTLKWYKDGREFYRHQPGITRQAPDHKCVTDYVYHVEGVTVDCWVSSEREVVLRRVTASSSGEYKCEVIGDHPKFRKEVRKASLTVFTEALLEPRIEGDEDSYGPGDQVSLNCSSPNTQYVPVLSWLVNGHPIPQRYVTTQAGGRSVGLLLQVTLDLFRHGAMAVTCVSSLGSSHSRESLLRLPNKDLLTSHEFYHNAGVPRVCYDWTFVRLQMLLLLILAQLY